jgi:hypothetical protein
MVFSLELIRKTEGTYVMLSSTHWRYQDVDYDTLLSSLKYKTKIIPNDLKTKMIYNLMGEYRLTVSFCPDANVNPDANVDKEIIKIDRKFCCDDIFWIEICAEDFESECHEILTPYIKLYEPIGHCRDGFGSIVRELSIMHDTEIVLKNLKLSFQRRLKD